MRTNTDVIFLSDLRLKRKDGFDITNKLRAALLKGTGRKYEMWENSNKKARGWLYFWPGTLILKLLTDTRIRIKI
jgi:hypothetical protein